MKGRVAILGIFFAARTLGADPGANANADGPAKNPLIQIQFVPAPVPVALEAFTLEQLNAALLQETNRVRVAHGCRTLRPLAALAAAADDQTAFMALTMHVAHSNAIKGQRDALDRAKRHGLSGASLVAENVLSVSFGSPREQPMSCAEVAAKLVDQWMNSPGHRANLLNHEFTDLGCAARRVKFLGGVENIFATQVFAAR